MLGVLGGGGREILLSRETLKGSKLASMEIRGEERGQWAPGEWAAVP